MNKLIEELKNDELTYKIGEESIHVFYSNIWFEVAIRPDYYILYDESGLVGYYRDCDSLLAAIYEY